MASEKRPASDNLGGGQMVVKRPNLGNNSKALATTNGSAVNGALIQAVCTLCERFRLRSGHDIRGSY
jgi:Prp8 binding protein